MNFHPVSVGSITIGNDLPFILMAGPCQLETLDHALFMADRLSTLCQKLGIPFIYKTSFDKANRTSGKTERGLGLEKSLSIFSQIRTQLGCPIMTDVHLPDHCATLAEVVDVLQIPAFLCRQTDLLVAAALTGKAINIKKGQFLAPWDMKNVAQKISDQGNNQIMLCERGSSFGYNTLVNDMKGLPIMAKTGFPVIFDASHSVQQPGNHGDRTGGQREFIPVLARAAIAVGVAGIFIETHENPDHAPSDGPNMLPVDQLPNLLGLLKDLDHLAKQNPVII